ncbi:hypothetical protein ACFQVC_34125 [Streptomyces monticola]|uniref:DUF3592 domain-containing protein n=1 Tax=Streptomyces monticola TaxID=2666263 RepID=A0ABW2JSV0_9ACTN
MSEIAVIAVVGGILWAVALLLALWALWRTRTVVSWAITEFAHDSGPRGLFVVTLANCGTGTAHRVRVRGSGEDEMVGTVARVPPGGVVHVHLRVVAPLYAGGADELPEHIDVSWTQAALRGRRRRERVSLDRQDLPHTLDELLSRGFVDGVNHYDI